MSHLIGLQAPRSARYHGPIQTAPAAFQTAPAAFQTAPAAFQTAPAAFQENRAPRLAYPDRPDTHELLKADMFGSSAAACDSHFEKNRPCPEAAHGLSDVYVTLDSFNKGDTSDPARGYYHWDFMIEGVTRQQQMGLWRPVDNVVQTSIQSFRLPLLQDVPYILTPAPYPGAPNGLDTLIYVQNNANIPPLPASPVLVPDAAPYGQYPLAALLPPATTRTPWPANPYSQAPCGGRITLQITETGVQSYSDRGGARHHFELALGWDPLYPGGLIAHTPSDGWETYTYTEPVKEFQGVSLQFRGPDTPLVFEPDVLAASAAADGAVLPAPGNFLRIDCAGHGLCVGDRVFFQGLASGSAVLDSALNRPEGYAVSAAPGTVPFPGTGEPIPTPDSFWTDAAISLANLNSPPALPAPVTVFVAKRRLRIPLRFRKYVQRTTNYLTGVAE